MKQNHYLYKIVSSDNCQKKRRKRKKERNGIKKLTQGHNLESAVTTHL